MSPLSADECEAIQLRNPGSLSNVNRSIIANEIGHHFYKKRHFTTSIDGEISDKKINPNKIAGIVLLINAVE
jgi:hypothetical protein